MARRNLEHEKRDRLDPPRRETRETYKAMRERFYLAQVGYDDLERWYFEALVALDAERGFPPRGWKAKHPTMYERTFPGRGLYVTVCQERFSDGYVRWQWKVYRDDLVDADPDEEGLWKYGREYRAIDAIREALRVIRGYHPSDPPVEHGSDESRRDKLLRRKKMGKCSFCPPHGGYDNASRRERNKGKRKPVRTTIRKGGEYV